MESEEQLLGKLSVESARFVLDHTEKRLLATIDTAKAFTERAVNVMQFSIPLSLVSVGLITSDPGKELLWLYLVTLILSVIISLLAFNLYDTDIEWPDQPTLSHDEKYFSSRTSEQWLLLIFNALENDQKAIELNESRNLSRQATWFWITSHLKFLILFGCGGIPMALFLVYTQF